MIFNPSLLQPDLVLGGNVLKLHPRTSCVTITWAGLVLDVDDTLVPLRQ
jgi:predicted HAD superfamily phosphohydrolase YqeG